MEIEKNHPPIFTETPEMQHLRTTINPETPKEEFIAKLGEYQDLGQQSLEASGVEGVKAQIKLTILTAQLRIQAGRDPSDDFEDALMAAEGIGDWDLADEIQSMIDSK